MGASSLSLRPNGNPPRDRPNGKAPIRISVENIPVLLEKLLHPPPERGVLLPGQVRVPGQNSLGRRLGLMGQLRDLSNQVLVDKVKQTMDQANIDKTNIDAVCDRLMIRAIPI